MARSPVEFSFPLTDKSWLWYVTTEMVDRWQTALDDYGVNVRPLIKAAWQYYCLNPAARRPYRDIQPWLKNWISKQITMDWHKREMGRRLAAR